MSNETKKCPHCGGIVSVSAKKCKHCKKWIEVEHQQINDTRVTPRKNEEIEINPFVKSTPSVFLIVAIIFLILGFGTIFTAQSAIQEIEGVLCVLIGIISLAIVPIYAQLEYISKKIENITGDKR